MSIHDARVMMYGKHFASMYEGSMIGLGSAVFAVWGYVIGNMLPDKPTQSFIVSLNPKKLSFIIGEKESIIEKAIETLLAPDNKSRTKEAQGRRLIKVSEYEYKVVNGMTYFAIKNLEEKRAYDREAKAKERAAKKAAAKISPHDGPHD